MYKYKFLKDVFVRSPVAINFISSGRLTLQCVDH